jgi:hypothetical protein
MNNDGDDIYMACPNAAYFDLARRASTAAASTPHDFWAHRCQGLEDSHVDSIFYSTGGNGFTHSLDSKAVDLPPGLGIADLLVQGRDALSRVIEFGRLHGLEVFWSDRMNDTHDNWHPCMLTQYKREHPEVLLFQPQDIGRPRQGLMEPHMNATALDYGREEVRERAYEIIRAVCEGYDVDGIELDFLRQPIYFRPTLDGLPVEAEQIALMTGFMARVRALAESAGKARGRPIPVAVCVPNVPALALSIGLDVEAWLRADLIDIVIASLEHTPYTGSLTEMADMAHRHDAPVYARLSGNLGTVAGWLGAETNARRAGVDGIETFNLFNPRWEGLGVLGEPAATAARDKTFAVDAVPYSFCRTWAHVVERDGRLPCELALGKITTLRLPVGDDIAAQARDGHAVDLVMTLTVEHLTYSDEIEFRLNGTPIEAEVYSAAEGVSPLACGVFVLYAKPAPELLRLGDNTIEAYLRRRCESASGLPTIVELKLLVRYGA